MAGGHFSSGPRQAPLSEINVVPLVDVMLVLLAIFIITAPLLTHAVKVDLPKASSRADVARPEHIEFAIRADGGLYWNGAAVAPAELPARFAAAAARQPQPELRIHADRQARYDPVAQTLAQAARAGLGRIGFVTEPAR